MSKADQLTGAKSVVNRKVDDLIPYDNNARVHSGEQVDQIVSSIKQFGFTAPIIIDEENMIMAGHGRYAAAKKMELETVPCIVLKHLTPEQKRAYVIADNRIAENAQWNKELLALEMTELDIADFDLSVLGFSDKELEKLLPGEGAIMDEMPDLPEGEKSEYQQMTFTLHNTQGELVKTALKAAKKIGKFDDKLNKNSNGNALTLICEKFLETHADS
ncbi:MAG: ParB N-terminal domain-containing protein [Rhodospirillales bacterium]|nr:ParB N-terminal domain-containing protein [Rhodospirillales bacterium]MCB9994834.1 ParB N-terminal domain-containing protein [Rhodospirillales bacterium]